MFTLELRCRPDEMDLLIAELWEEGTSGITEFEGGLRAFFDDAHDRDALARHFAQYEPECDEVPDEDWVAVSRSVWEPISAGSRFFIVPDWRDDPTPPGRFRIEVNPGMAFGTGVHETTRLCMEALERRVRTGMTVVDVGTGSGILAQAARLLGAERVAGCDLDAVAAGIARVRVPVFAGSLDAVRSESADLIVANISPVVVSGLAGDLRRCLVPAGIALLSGFEHEDLAAVGAALSRAGLRRVSEFGENTWRLLEYQRTDHG